MAVESPPRQLTDFLRSLRGVREFQRKPVPDDVVQDILEVARWSGSAGNRQPAEIVVVRERQSLEALAGLGGYVGHVRAAAIAMLLVMPGDWPEGETFDEGRVAERIMLAAWAHGVGSSIGWFSEGGVGRRNRSSVLRASVWSAPRSLSATPPALRGAGSANRSLSWSTRSATETPDGAR